jgi:hypothetical protein
VAGQHPGTHVKGPVRLPRERGTQAEELPEFWRDLHRTAASLAVEGTQGTVWIVAAEQSLQASHLMDALG